jgi:hypothetical protein
MDVDVNVVAQARAAAFDDGQQDQVLIVEGIEERIDPVSVTHYIGGEQE